MRAPAITEWTPKTAARALILQNEKPAAATHVSTGADGSYGNAKVIARRRGYREVVESS